jgi:hypothetical protein
MKCLIKCRGTEALERAVVVLEGGNTAEQDKERRETECTEKERT